MIKNYLRAFVFCKSFEAIDVCGSEDPCINSTCTKQEFPPYYTCENCSHGKHGFNCDIGMIVITL